VQRLDDLSGRRRFWFVQDRQVLRGVRRVARQVGVTEVSRLDVGRHGRTVVVTDVEATTDGEERLTGWVVVRHEGPAAAPEAERVRGSGAVADHGVEAFGRSRNLDTDRSPVSDFGGDLLGQSRCAARVDHTETQRLARCDAAPHWVALVPGLVQVITPLAWSNRVRSTMPPRS